MAAAAAGQLESIAALVGHGLPVDFESKKGQTAMMAAAAAGQFPSIDMLVGCGANINYESRAGQGLTLVHFSLNVSTSCGIRWVHEFPPVY
jgi:ankyrin repeat protein